MTNIQSVIEKLIAETKNTNLKWNYLSELSILLRKSAELIGYEVIDNTSFYVQIKDGYFVLYEDVFQNLYLITYPTIDSKDYQCLNRTPNMILNQQDLLRLQNLIKKQFPNVDDFLDEFINS